MRTRLLALGLVASFGLVVAVARPVQGQLSKRDEVMAALAKARTQARTCGTQAFPAAPKWATNSMLGKAAELHAVYMSRLGTLTHTGANNSTAKDWAVKEGYPATLALDLVYGSTNDATAQQIVDSWLKDPAHCALVMNTSYGFTDAGAGEGVKPDPTGTAMKYYWSVVLAKK